MRNTGNPPTPLSHTDTPRVGIDSIVFCQLSWLTETSSGSRTLFLLLHKHATQMPRPNPSAALDPSHQLTLLFTSTLLPQVISASASFLPHTPSFPPRYIKYSAFRLESWSNHPCCLPPRINRRSWAAGWKPSPCFARYFACSISLTHLCPGGAFVFCISVSTHVFINMANQSVTLFTVRFSGFLAAL